MKVLAFKASHLADIERQTDVIFGSISELNRKNLQDNGNTYTCISSNGRVLACGGLVRFWENRAEAWAIFDKYCGTEFLLIHRATLRLMEVSPFRRIEATVELGFKEGHRWMKSLGFKQECAKLEKYFANGKDAALYARVR